MGFQKIESVAIRDGDQVQKGCVLQDRGEAFTLKHPQLGQITAGLGYQRCTVNEAVSYVVCFCVKGDWSVSQSSKRKPITRENASDLFMELEEAVQRGHD